MPECKTCGKSIRAWEAVGGACEDCFSHLKKKEDAAESQLRQKEDAAERELAQCLLPQPTPFKASKLPNILV